MANIRSVCSILFLIITFMMACRTSESDPDSIIQKPIVFNETGKKLSLQYLEDRYGIVKKEPAITPRMIVLHWTAIPTLEETFEIFDQPVLPATREGICCGFEKVGPH